jgi:hypothetical protein
MLITCDNKGCLATTNAKLKVDTLEVICEACNRPIRNVSDTMKRVLKSEGQIVRDEERKAFTMGCKACNANRQVVLDENDNTVCSICGAPINVHPAMKQAIIEAGVRLAKQVDSEERPKVKTTRKKKTSKKKGK